MLGVGDTREEHFLQAVDKWSDVYTRFVQEQDRLDPESPHIFYVQNYMSKRAVDPETIPRFRFEELSLKESLENAVFDWALLTLELIVALFLSVVAFERAPVSKTV